MSDDVDLSYPLDSAPDRMRYFMHEAEGGTENSSQEYVRRYMSGYPDGWPTPDADRFEVDAEYQRTIGLIYDRNQDIELTPKHPRAQNWQFAVERLVGGDVPYTARLFRAADTHKGRVRSVLVDVCAYQIALSPTFAPLGVSPYDAGQLVTEAVAGWDPTGFNNSRRMRGPGERLEVEPEVNIYADDFVEREVNVDKALQGAILSARDLLDMLAEAVDGASVLAKLRGIVYFREIRLIGRIVPLLRQGLASAESDDLDTFNQYVEELLTLEKDLPRLFLLARFNGYL